MNKATELTMSSKVIAKVTCIKHAQVIKDIYEMLGEMELETVTGLTATDVGTRKVSFTLNKLMTYRLIMRYDRDEQDAVLCEWQDIEYPVDPSLMIYQTPRTV
jgi:hypothetical protein